MCTKTQPCFERVLQSRWPDMTAQRALLEDMQGLLHPAHAPWTREEGHGLGTHRRVVPVCHYFLTPDLNSEATVGRERGDQATFKQIHPGEWALQWKQDISGEQGAGRPPGKTCSEEVPAAQLEGWVGTRMWKRALVGVQLLRVGCCQELELPSGQNLSWESSGKLWPGWWHFSGETLFHWKPWAFMSSKTIGKVTSHWNRRKISEPRLVGWKVLEMQIVNLKNWDRKQGCQTELLSAASAASLAQYFRIKLNLQYMTLNI